MLPLAALLDSKLDPNARAALAVTILLTIASAMLNPYGLDVLSLPFKTIGTSDIATVAVPELKPMFSIVPVEAVILIVISVVPVIFHAKCLGFKKTVFSFETMMISGLLFLSLMTWRNELLLLGILMIVYSTWCWKLEPKCKVSSKMLSRIVLFSISVVALEFGAVVAYTGYTPSQKHKAGVSSEWTLGGQFPKAVRRINDRLLLFKTGTSGARNLGKEPYSEYFAAQVAKRMGIDHVSYDLEMWKGKLASVCGLMNDKEISFVPFFVAAGDASFPAALSILNELDPKMASIYRTMVVFDALICNRDRHGGNFGILRENRTGRLLGLAPLFDHNLSLFAQDDETDYADFLDRSNRYYLPATANIAFNDMAGIVMGAEQHELLRRMIGFEFQNHPTYPLPQDRLGALNHYITEKVRELLRIPIVDEHALCKAMEEKFNEIQATTKIPMLLDSVKMIHKKGLPLSEKAEEVKRGSKVFENTLNKIIPEEDRCR